MMRTYTVLLSRSILGTVAAKIRPRGGKPYTLANTPPSVAQYLGIAKPQTRLTELSWPHALGLTANGTDLLKVTRQEPQGRVYVTFRCDDGKRGGPSLKARLAAARADVQTSGGFVIRDLAGLCRHFDADTPGSLNRRVYKGTDCGASLSLYLKDGTVLHNGDHRWDTLAATTPIDGFTIQTIVEGSDATVDSDLFLVPVASGAITRWIDEMEAAAAQLWTAANEEEFDEA